MNTSPVIEVKNLTTGYGETIIHENLDLVVNRGEVLGVVGGSGTGKSVLMNTVIGLRRVQGGTVKIFGQDIRHAHSANWSAINRRWGVLFQQGALWSNLTIKENVTVPLFEHTDMLQDEIDELADLKIALAGLPYGACAKKPSELSGGMIKRAALARAVVMDPKLLFFDEPSAGLDPVVSAELDELILRLRDAMRMSMVVVTHELDSAFKIADKITVLDQGKVLMSGTVDEVRASDHERVQDLLNRRPRDITVDPDEYLKRLTEEQYG